MSRWLVIVFVGAVLFGGAPLRPLSAQSPEASPAPPADAEAARDAAGANGGRPKPSAETGDSGDSGGDSGDSSGGASQRAQRAQRLANYLSDVKFVGRFTVEGQEAEPKEEEYVITRCEKLPAEHMYRLTARIRYGEVDSEVPLELKILWAGNTPVITLDALWIPGMGTFSARVLIHRDRYSGTWQHGEHGGHLFGRVVPVDEAP